MKLFLDANVLVSVVNKEYPLFTKSARVLSLANRPGYQLYTSPLCLAITFYFAEKKSGAQQAKTKIAMLLEYLHIAPLDEKMSRQAIQHKAIHDFEDGMQYYAAEAAGCDAIITEDTGDYYFADMPVMDCNTLLVAVKNRI